MNDAKGRVAVVTGAANGIGLGIATRLAKAGYQVMLADKNSERLEAERSALASQGATVAAHPTDVTVEDEVSGLIEAARATYSRVEVLVNSAGLQWTAPIEEFPTDKFDHLLRVMLIGPFLTIKHSFPHMKAQKFGRIINIASTHAIIAAPLRAGYDAAKHGLLGLTKVAALEGALHGITANAICPGYVDTAMVRTQYEKYAEEQGRTLEEVMHDAVVATPQQRFISVDEVADYALFLASDQVKGVTGQALAIDGGWVVP